MKIGILGGSFNPPHAGHGLIALQTKEYANLDRIILMPCPSHPFGKELADASHRLAMIKYLETNGVEVSDFELKENPKGISIMTLDTLSKQHPEHSYFWIIGSDQIADFKKWDGWERIITDYGLIVFPRDMRFGELQKTMHEQFGLLAENIQLIVSERLIINTISSSKIRERIREKKSISFMTEKKVEEYIKKNKLYKLI